MPFDLARAMREATNLTRAAKVGDATRVIQAALAGGRGGGEPTPGATYDDGTGSTPLLEGPTSAGAKSGTTHSDPEPFAGKLGLRRKWSLGDVVRTLREAKFRGPTSLPLRGKANATAAIPTGAQFLTRSFTGHAGTRTYKLYVPAGREPGGLPLVVMLHGCTQDPDDFALGTHMNELAEEFGFFVAYPCQPRSANPSSCWNWFEPKDQVRDRGEPSIIAGITAAIVSEYDLDRSRVFIAGLSAGGAMAAVMGETYPDIYAAIGVHSGLPYGAASDVMSAFAAMRGETGLPRRPGNRSARTPRTIVFHGDADRTVHPDNGARIVVSGHRDGGVESGRAGGRAFTRTVTQGPDEAHRDEYWLLAGAGHAWSGGSPGGSYTDVAGPDASREMVRFFLAAGGPEHRS